MGQIAITNRLITDPQWLKPAACSFKTGGNVDVWKIITQTDSSLIDDILPLLTDEEKARADRFYRQRDRERFIVSRGALKHILGKYSGQSASTIEFGIGENKKPYVKSQGTLNLQFNLSHSEDALLLAVSNFAIGADVEYINLNFSFSEVLEDNFSNAEIAYINEINSASRFFRIWTRKEALTKATAQGLDGDLRLLPGLDGVHQIQPGIIASNNDWLITSFNLNDNYTASIANAPAVDKIVFFDIGDPKNLLVL
ncbi:MAG: 4'-phosphopantetheinyl transferase superfamily protein [Bacteroidota bacterium]|nr:4'-phosphopantetheinyl transferase superfamily protein [Bacteroidota bacterium]